VHAFYSEGSARRASAAITSDALNAFSTASTVGHAHIQS
jgi:hypothetical protein